MIHIIALLLFILFIFTKFILFLILFIGIGFASSCLKSLTTIKYFYIMPDKEYIVAMHIHSNTVFNIYFSTMLIWVYHNFII